MRLACEQLSTLIARARALLASSDLSRGCLDDARILLNDAQHGYHVGDFVSVLLVRSEILLRAATSFPSITSRVPHPSPDG